jgi:hypothetical protein
VLPPSSNAIFFFCKEIKKPKMKLIKKEKYIFDEENNERLVKIKWTNKWSLFVFPQIYQNCYGQDTSSFCPKKFNLSETN